MTFMTKSINAISILPTPYMFTMEVGLVTTGIEHDLSEGTDCTTAVMAETAIGAASTGAEAGEEAGAVRENAMTMLSSTKFHFLRNHYWNHHDNDNDGGGWHHDDQDDQPDEQPDQDPVDYPNDGDIIDEEIVQDGDE
ncbi:hypothetical protein ACHAWO_013378 [Cyclotella atomus]|uniref:Uncharacterized protein n=1 Tax=Cyclotella atomus TaxID=382360 RepID=A0ABD3NYV5_9STRA